MKQLTTYTIKYFYQLFNHSGCKRLLDAMYIYYHPKLRYSIETYTVKLARDMK